MSLIDRWQTIMCDLRSVGRYRELKPPTGIDFTSNDYLGYASLLPATSSLSSSGAASRLLRGHHPIWTKVEEELANWHESETALVMNSGYAANEGLLSTIIEAGDWVASDERNHASIIDGLRLTKAHRFVYRHGDLDHLESGLRARPSSGEAFIVTESLFGMDGDVVPLEQIANLAERYGAHVIVDEAHATGCFGPRGAGCVAAYGQRSHVLATVHTGGKALGVPGAYVCASRLLCELLVNRCRQLIFTTALPPAIGEWWLAAIDRVQRDDSGRTRLHDNARYFRTALADRGIRPGGEAYIVPIILGQDAAAVHSAESLQNRGWDVRAIRPPTVSPGSARLRVSIHADHNVSTLHQLAQGIAEVIRSS